MQAQRDEKGRFLAGTPGGPGRPCKVAELDYLRALTEKCTPERWGKIVERAVNDAEGGDDKARSWLTSYLIGKPAGAAPTVTAVVVAEEIGANPGLEREIRTAREKQLLDLF